MSLKQVKLKRVYEPPENIDGKRILVDRLWPRGLSKEAACIDEWMRDVSLSHELRKWFAHQPERFVVFRERYVEELLRDPDRSEKVKQLCEWACEGTITLLYAAKDFSSQSCRRVARRDRQRLSCMNSPLTPQSKRR
ncbi:hypothetical protein DNHGIG_17800 [Collibacillus ludicampi]|uniref:DUF488 domain-containing protein n=1 Tax=Collibacillus ludicampi TaxID=2771369 RepID=A0AAV4LEL7_9BACL|nr:hypothetical protein DNHGIG_17800 [Collibacillus ludicampi]